MKSMLDHVSSPELTEWMAYEKFSGPIGSQYRDEVLRAQVELLRMQNYLIGGQFKSNPVQRPVKPYPMPHEIANIPEEGDQEWPQ